MKARPGKWSLALAVLAGCVLLAVLLSVLGDAGLFSRPSGEPEALTGYGPYSPVAIDGEVYFPTVSESGLSYELARRAQARKGTPALMSEAGRVSLPADYIQRLYAAFGKVEYTPDAFHDYDRHYLIVIPGSDIAVCGVIIRHDEQFYLGNLDCELSDELLAELASALTALDGE